MTFEEESVADEKEVSECNRLLARIGNLSMSTHEAFCQLQPSTMHLSTFVSPLLDAWHLCMPGKKKRKQRKDNYLALPIRQAQ